MKKAVGAVVAVFVAILVVVGACGAAANAGGPITTASVTAVAVRGVVPHKAEVNVQRCPVGSTVVVVGDSITELGAPYLRADLIAAGYVPWVNARGGRTIGQGVEPVWGFGEEHNVQRCWVIALGTNDTFFTDPSTWMQAINDLRYRMSDFEPLWWVPVAVPQGDVINRLLTTGARPVQLVDWSPTAADLSADNVHPNPSGAARWAAEVMASLTA